MLKHDLNNAINGVCEMRQSPLTNEDAYDGEFLYYVFLFIIYKEISTEWKLSNEDNRLLSFLLFKNYSPENCDNKIQSIHELITNGATKLMDNQDMVEKLQMYILVLLDDPSLDTIFQEDDT